MKKKRLFLCALAVLVLFLGIRYYDYAVLVTSGFAGTYTSGSAPTQLIFSVDSSKHMFYYADQQSGTYIAGHYEECGADSYSISCQDPGKADIIPDQVVVRSGDLSLSVTVNGQAVSFQKKESVPVLIGDRSRYS